MQDVTSQFQARSEGNMRQISWRLLMSFEKDLDAAIDFFTIGVSLIGGTDIIKGDGDAVQEWDKYAYADYSDRVVSVEWTRQQDPVFSVTQAMADIVLNNYDDYFTPGRGSAIDAFILPYRPIKIFSGFGGEELPQFVGMTDKMPIIDEKAKTATFHAIDFLYTVLNRKLTQDYSFEEYRSDLIIAEILEDAGLLSSQYELDIAFNTIPFVYYQEDALVGDILRDLVQAELGRLYMDENGKVVFKNRQSYIEDSVMTFDASNIVGRQSKNQDDIVNSVHVLSEVSEVRDLQSYWLSTEQYAGSGLLVPAGGTFSVIANFDDPVTTVDAPVYVDTAVTSVFETNTMEDGSGTPNAGDVTLAGTELFNRSYRMDFANGGSDDLYLTLIELYVTPVQVVRTIDITVKDDASIAQFELHDLEIENNLIQNDSDANSIGAIILADFSEVSGIQEMDVKGTPALQIGDPITTVLSAVEELYRITKIVNTVQGGRFRQLISVKARQERSYFTIGVSLIGGTDEIAP